VATEWRRRWGYTRVVILASSAVSLMICWRGLFDDLLDSPGRVRGMMNGFKEVSYCAVAKVGPQLLSKFWQDRNIAALATLGLREQDHLLVKEQLLGCDVHELGVPGVTAGKFTVSHNYLVIKWLRWL